MENLPRDRKLYGAEMFDQPVVRHVSPEESQPTFQDARSEIQLDSCDPCGEKLAL
jgi:hypothetical protein